MKKYLENKWFLVALALVVGLLMGYIFWHSSGSEEQHAPHDVAEHADETTWTCSMHPQIRQSEPGQCPICGMDLIPLRAGESNADPMAVSMTKTAIKLAGIQTMTIGSAAGAEKVLRLNGTVMPNERLVKSLSAHVAGRVEQLFVNTTGEYVRRGQRLASIYSPELIAAQRELLQTAAIKDSQPALYKAAVNKLKAFKLQEGQINNIAESGEIRQTIDIQADQSGIVIEKKVNVGDYLKKGEALYVIADLSKVWVEFDAYESDLPWIKIGDKVNFKVASLPGQQFEGKVTFIEPTVNRQSRVAGVRVEIPNPDQKLKPQMFATGTIKTAVSGGQAQITLPKSAIMWTGERSVVYVKEKNAEAPAFMVREVELGPSLGNLYVIEKGLEVGEEVVVNGTFTVDAAAQLAGKPSMMNPEGGAAATGHNHGQSVRPEPVQVAAQAREVIEGLISRYYKIKDALVASDKEEAIAAARVFKKQLDQVPMKAFEGKAHDTWMALQGRLNESVNGMLASGNIDQARKSFIALSEAMVDAAHAFGPFDKAVYVQHCPMANDDQGADWLSEIDEIRNPYYGDMMLTCGEVTKTIE